MTIGDYYIYVLVLENVVSKKTTWELIRTDANLLNLIKRAIPKGPYCYSLIGSEENKDGISFPKTQTCPFWDTNEEKGDQECGYCHLIGKGDWDLNEETTSEIDIPFGLLWDQVKECGLNDEWDDDEDLEKEKDVED